MAKGTVVIEYDTVTRDSDIHIEMSGKRKNVRGYECVYFTLLNVVLESVRQNCKGDILSGDEVAKALSAADLAVKDILAIVKEMRDSHGIDEEMKSIVEKYLPK